ncbi:MAG: cyclic nucleotide-binding domain-containing protein [Planctomycetota bacterium]
MNQPPQSAVRRVFAHSTLRRVILSWGSSKTAFWGWAITINAVLFLHGGAWAVGAFLAARIMPGALAAPLVAVLFDRLGLMRGLTLLGWVRTTAMAVSAALVGLDAPLTWLIAVGVLESFGSQPQESEQIRVLPWLARSPDELTAANGITELLRMAGILVGPAIGSLLLLWIDASLVLAVFAAANLASALLLLGLGDAVAPVPGDRTRTVCRSLADGGSMVLGDRDCRGLALLTCGASIGAGSLQVFGAGLALDHLALGPSGPLMLSAAFGLGGLLGGIATIMLAGRRDLAFPTLAAAVAMGALIALMGLIPTTVAVATCMVLAGACLVVLLVAAATLLQRGVPQRLQAAVIGLSTLVSRTGLGVAGIVTSALVTWLGFLPAIVAVGLSLIVIALLAAPRLRQFAARGTACHAEAEILRACPVFRALPVGPLERLAASLERVALDAGTTPVRAGDRGDDAYVVETGNLAVLADGAEIGALGRGDLFGEVALLENRPRSATITARAPSVVYRLRREAFVTALAASTESQHRARELARDRS